jgi:16S rRNA (guanine966-N2)-methyltransferase
VFLDPPYDVPAEQVEEILRMLAGGWLADGAVVVVERGDDVIRWPGGYSDHWARGFGDTHVLRAFWYRPD